MTICWKIFPALPAAGKESLHELDDSSSATKIGPVTIYKPSTNACMAFKVQIYVYLPRTLCFGKHTLESNLASGVSSGPT